jgi:hypothetical protein
MTDTPPELVTRTCDKCGQTDSDPHHVQYVAFNHPVTGEPTDLSVSKHVDCCAEDGCPICSLDMANAPQGAHAETMREFLQNRPTELNQQQFEQNAIESPEFSIPATGEEPTA